MEKINITVFHDNHEILREKLNGSEKISEVVKRFKCLFAKTNIKHDEDRVTVWVLDQPMYIAYRKIDDTTFEMIVINNHDTFQFIIDHNFEVYVEDINGNKGNLVATISDFINACCK